nr:MAG TPA: hypothetical protein [Caudoviricetes sp.]
MVKRRLKAAFVSISEGIEIFCFFIRKCLYQIVIEMSKGSYVYAKKTDDLP